MWLIFLLRPAAINKLHNTFIFAKTDLQRREVVGCVQSSLPTTTNHSILLLSASLSLQQTHAAPSGGGGSGGGVTVPSLTTGHHWPLTRID